MFRIRGYEYTNKSRSIHPIFMLLVFTRLVMSILLLFPPHTCSVHTPSSGCTRHNVRACTAWLSLSLSYTRLVSGPSGQADVGHLYKLVFSYELDALTSWYNSLTRHPYFSRTIIIMRTLVAF